MAKLWSRPKGSPPSCGAAPGLRAEPRGAPAPGQWALPGRLLGGSDAYPKPCRKSRRWRWDCLYKGLEMDRPACWGRTQVLACGVQGPSHGSVGGIWRGWQRVWGGCKAKPWKLPHCLGSEPAVPQRCFESGCPPGSHLETVQCRLCAVGLGHTRVRSEPSLCSATWPLGQGSVL